MSLDSIRMLRSTITRRGRTSSGGTNIFFLSISKEKSSHYYSPENLLHSLFVIWDWVIRHYLYYFGNWHVYLQRHKGNPAAQPLLFPAPLLLPSAKFYQHFFLGRGEDTSLVSQHDREHFQPLLHLLQPYEKSPISPPKEQHYFFKVFFFVFLLVGVFCISFFFKEGHFPHFSLQLKWRQGQAIYVWL